MDKYYFLEKLGALYIFKKKACKVSFLVVEDTLLLVPTLLGRDSMKIMEIQLLNKKQINADKNFSNKNFNYESNHIFCASLFTSK